MDSDPEFALCRQGAECVRVDCFLKHPPERSERISLYEPRDHELCLDEVPMPLRPDVTSQNVREVFIEDLSEDCKDVSAPDSYLTAFGDIEEAYCLEGTNHAYIRYATFEAAAACVTASAGKWSESERALASEHPRKRVSKKRPKPIYPECLLDLLGGKRIQRQIHERSGVQHLRLVDSSSRRVHFSFRATIGQLTELKICLEEILALYHVRMSRLLKAAANPRQVLIKGLPAEFTSAQVAELCSFYGEVERTTELAPREAVVFFVCPEAARDAAAGLDGEQLLDEDPPLHCKLLEADDSPETDIAASSTDSSCVLHISGLPRDATEEDLREMCEPVGKLKSVRLTFEKLTGKVQRFAFAEFESADDLQRALKELQGTLLAGSKLRFSRATSVQVCSQAAAGTADRHRAENLERLTGPCLSKVLFVGNLPPHADDEELRQVCSEAGCDDGLAEVRAPQGRQIGFLEFVTSADAEKALHGLQGASCRGHVLRVMIEGRFGAIGDEAPSETFFVGNLSMDVTEEDLKSVCNEAGCDGSLIEVTLVQDRSTLEAKAIGYGFLTFACADDAANALQCLQGKLCHDRPLRFTIAESNSAKRDSWSSEALPSSEDVDTFLEDNCIDERASAIFRSCPPEVQHRVLMSKQSLKQARCPSTTLLLRTRQARYTDSASGDDAAVTQFIEDEQIDGETSAILMNCCREVRRYVIARGPLCHTENPSAVLRSRIRFASKQDTTPTVSESTYPTPEKVEEFIEKCGIDYTDSTAGLLRQSDPKVQRRVLTFHASTELQATGSSSWLLASIISIQTSFTKESGPVTQDELEWFIANNSLEERVIAELRMCPPLVLKRVVGRGPLTFADDPSEALRQRIQDAWSYTLRCLPHMKQTDQQPQELQQFIAKHGIEGHAAETLRNCSAQVQKNVMIQADIAQATISSTEIIARVRAAEQVLGLMCAAQQSGSAVLPPLPPPPPPSMSAAPLAGISPIATLLMGHWHPQPFQASAPPKEPPPARLLEGSSVQETPAPSLTGYSRLRLLHQSCKTAAQPQECNWTAAQSRPSSQSGFAAGSRDARPAGKASAAAAAPPSEASRKVGQGWNLKSRLLKAMAEDLDVPVIGVSAFLCRERSRTPPRQSSRLPPHSAYDPFDEAQSDSEDYGASSSASKRPRR